MEDIRQIVEHHLKTNGFPDIWIDYAPEKPSIRLFFYDNNPYSYLPSKGRYHIQIQIRSEVDQPDLEVLEKLTAITSLFIPDTGLGIDPIIIQGHEYYCQIRKNPALLMRNGDDTNIFYSEITLRE